MTKLTVASPSAHTLDDSADDYQCENIPDLMYLSRMVAELNDFDRTKVLRWVGSEDKAAIEHFVQALRTDGFVQMKQGSRIAEPADRRHVGGYRTTAKMRGV